MGVEGVHPCIFYFCIFLCLCHIVLANDLHSTCPSLMSCPSSAEAEAHTEELLHLCTTLQGHLDINLSSPLVNKEEDPWKQMKWIGQAATCRVKGHLIEKLDPELNFRRGFALKFSACVEDKTHMLPWLFATRVDLNARKRRVYLDLGASSFSTSITWFLQMYPCDFTEVHAFEVNEDLLRKPQAGFEEELNHAQPNGRSVMVKEVAGVPAWMLSRIHVYNNLVSDYDDVASKAVNITRFMKEELKLEEGDAVVVKMDIEGSEWPILQRWIADADMAAIVDELFVEVHYDHATMRDFAWHQFAPATRQHAHSLLAELRSHGFFAHAWP